MQVLMKKSRKKLADKKIIIFLESFLQAINPWASIKDVQATEEAPALKREHPALQYMEFLHISLFLLVIFVILDPDSDLAN
jgi:hypothetical protein